MSKSVEFDLPWPPSVNRYWRHPTRGPLAGRHLVSQEGRAYRAAVLAACHRQRVHNARLSGRLGITITVEPPDRRRRDLDNLCKATFDALVWAMVVRDDEQFDDIRLSRRAVVAEGRLLVRIDVLDEAGS